MTDYMCPADPTVTHCYHAAKVNEIICAHTDTIAALTARVEELEGALDGVLPLAESYLNIMPDRHGIYTPKLESARAALEGKQ